MSRGKVRKLSNAFDRVFPTEYQIEKCKDKIKTLAQKFEGGWKVENFSNALKKTILRTFEAEKLDTSTLDQMTIMIYSGYDSAGNFILRNGFKESSTHVLFGGFGIATITDQNNQRIFVEENQGTSILKIQKCNQFKVFIIIF